MPDTYSLKQNAVRAARKAIADGSAPAPTYKIKGAKGGFRIMWDVTEAEPPRQQADPVERDEDIDTNGSGDLSPEHERAAEGLRNSVEPPAPAKVVARLAKITELLQRPEGATIAEIQAITGWLPHTTRAFISVQIRRKAGLEVTTDKVEGRGRVYRVAA